MTCGGFVATDGIKIYFCGKNGIYSANTDGSNQKKVIDSTDDLSCINLYGGRIYYVSRNNIDSVYKIDRINTDGSNHQTVKQYVNISSMLIVGDTIYYTISGKISGNGSVDLHSMKIDGTDNKALGAFDPFGFAVVNDKIYYPYGAVYSMNLDGSAVKQISSEFPSYLNVVDAKIYYVGHKQFVL